VRVIGSFVLMTRLINALGGAFDKRVRFAPLGGAFSQRTLWCAFFVCAKRCAARSLRAT
jgi:hypothetical protein